MYHRTETFEIFESLNAAESPSMLAPNRDKTAGANDTIIRR